MPGLPTRHPAERRDLITINGEGIEATLLADLRHLLFDRKPTLLVEVLPGAERLGALLSALASDAGDQIHVLPEWGLDRVLSVPAAWFSAGLPCCYNPKDMVLSVGPLA